MKARELYLIEAVKVGTEQRAVTDHEVIEERSQYTVNVESLNSRERELRNELLSIGTLYTAASADLDTLKVQQSKNEIELKERTAKCSAAEQQVQSLSEQICLINNESKKMRESDAVSAAANASIQAADVARDVLRYDSLLLEQKNTINQYEKALESIEALKNENKTRDEVKQQQQQQQEIKKGNEEVLLKQIDKLQVELGSVRAELVSCADDLDTRIAEVGVLEEITIELQNQTKGLINQVQELEVTAGESEKKLSAEFEFEIDQSKKKLAEEMRFFEGKLADEKASSALIIKDTNASLESLRSELVALQDESEMKSSELGISVIQLDLSVQDMSVLREDSVASQSQVAGLHTGIMDMREQLQKTAAKFLEKIKALKSQVSSRCQLDCCVLP